MLSSFFSNTHTLVLFHWLLHHSIIFDSFPLMKNLRPQEIFFCSQSSQVLYSYFSSASLLCNPLSVGFFYVYWAPLCSLLSTAATSVEDNFLQALPEPIGWYPWSFQSMSTKVLSPLTPHPSGIHISFVDLPCPVDTNTILLCKNVVQRVSWRTQFSPSFPFS